MARVCGARLSAPKQLKLSRTIKPGPRRRHPRCVFLADRRQATPIPNTSHTTYRSSDCCTSHNPTITLPLLLEMHQPSPHSGIPETQNDGHEKPEHYWGRTTNRRSCKVCTAFSSPSRPACPLSRISASRSAFFPGTSPVLKCSGLGNFAAIWSARSDNGSHPSSRRGARKRTNRRVNKPREPTVGQLQKHRTRPNR